GCAASGERKEEPATNKGASQSRMRRHMMFALSLVGAGILACPGRQECLPHLLARPPEIYPAPPEAPPAVPLFDLLFGHFRKGFFLLLLEFAANAPTLLQKLHEYATRCRHKTHSHQGHAARLGPPDRIQRTPALEEPHTRRCRQQ